MAFSGLPTVASYDWPPRTLRRLGRCLPVLPAVPPGHGAHRGGLYDMEVLRGHPVRVRAEPLHRVGDQCQQPLTGPHMPLLLLPLLGILRVPGLGTGSPAC